MLRGKSLFYRHLAASTTVNVTCECHLAVAGVRRRFLAMRELG
jgi:hypothetical protein